MEFQDKHEGHTPGTLRDMASSMLTIHVRQWIEEKVESGLNWKAIKAMLRIDTDILDSVSFSSKYIVNGECYIYVADR